MSHVFISSKNCLIYPCLIRLLMKVYGRCYLMDSYCIKYIQLCNIINHLLSTIMPTKTDGKQQNWKHSLPKMLCLNYLGIKVMKYILDCRKAERKISGGIEFCPIHIPEISIFIQLWVVHECTVQLSKTAQDSMFNIFFNLCILNKDICVLHLSFDRMYKAIMHF